MNQHYLIDTNLIDNPGQDARISHEVSEFDDLLVSIRENGILQPLLVRQRGDRFEVIAGNRRLQVARQLGLTEIPAMVRNASDAEVNIFRLEENLKRAELNPIEEAKHIAESIGASGLTVKEFGQKINRSEQWIQDRFEVSNMPDYLQEFLMKKTLALGVALALNQITEEKVKRDWVYAAAKDGMTVLAAKAALHEYQKMERRREEEPDGVEPSAIPTTPPVAYVQCVRCGSRRPQQQTKFVRICNPVCPSEEGTESPTI